MKALIKLWFYRIKFLFPHALPTKNEDALYAFIKQVCEVYNMKNDLNTQYAIAQDIMQLPGRTTWKPPFYFIRGVVHMAAKEAAFLVLQDVKNKSLEEQKQAAEAKKLSLVPDGNTGVGTPV